MRRQGFIAGLSSAAGRPFLVRVQQQTATPPTLAPHTAVGGFFRDQAKAQSSRKSG
jgi:hypothetical protein